jgi:hypothetical protein
MKVICCRNKSLTSKLSFKVVLLCLLLLANFSPTTAKKKDVIPVDEEVTMDIFTRSSSSKDIQQIINTAVSQGQKYITIPAGKYYMEPNQENSRSHLFLNNLVDVEIDATGVELIWYVWKYFVPSSKEK